MNEDEKNELIRQLKEKIAKMRPSMKRSNLEWQLKQLLESKAPPPSGVEGFK